MNDSANLVCNAAGECPSYNINSLTGNSALASLTTAGLTVTTANLNFPGQINYTSATSGNNGNPTPLTFDNSATAVTGTTINMVGSANNASVVLPTGVVLTNCKVTGDGAYYVTGNQAIVSQGSTFAPVATNTANGAFANGALTFGGNLVCAKNAAGKNTQFVLGVTGSGGVVGTDYTQLVADCYTAWYGSLTSTITSAGSSNPLANAELTVNITPGMEPTKANLGDPTALWNANDLIISTGNDLSSTNSPR